MEIFTGRHGLTYNMPCKRDNLKVFKWQCHFFGRNITICEGQLFVYLISMTVGVCIPPRLLSVSNGAFKNNNLTTKQKWQRQWPGYRVICDLMITKETLY